MKYLALLFAILATPFAALGETKIDIGQKNDRRDVLTKTAENWIITDGPAATQRIGGVTFALRPGATGGTLAGALWKGGIDTGATLATDGVTVKGASGPAELQLTLTGLAPGRHSLTTYHNFTSQNDSGRYSLAVDGVLKAPAIVPPRRVASDYDAATTFVEFEAVADKDVVVTLKAQGPGDTLILNGLLLDGIDPAKQIGKPLPIGNDEHVAEKPALTWRPAASALSHDVYLGTSLDAVAKATHASPEFKGNLKDAAFPTTADDSWLDYYWRVDEICSGDPANPVKGDVSRFRIRHLAFPEAEGYGRFAIGGRGGKVLEVTNLNDSGAGSLRAAVEAVGPRMIVFRVGGTINLRSKLVVSNPYCTIAGQTAPGDGILLAGWTAAAAYGSHDVIIRYLRVRVGDLNGTNDGSGLGACDHCIVDHCSVAWSIDEAFSSRAARNITLQRSIIAEALNMSVHGGYVGTGKGHSFAASIGGQIGSFHHNLIVNCAGRNWSLAGALNQAAEFAGDMDIRNNIVYNWWHRTTDGGTRKLNFVNNLYIPGPGTLAKEPPFLYLLDPDAGIHPNNPDDFQRYYMAGNKMEGHPEFDEDNWKGALFRSVADGGPGDAAGVAHIRFDQPFFESYVTTQTADEAYKSVLADVGANIPHHDSVDARAVDNVKKRSFTFSGSKTGIKGIIDSQRDVGGWPVMQGGEAPKDTDHDGIPDDWETAHGLNPNDPADGAKKSTDGYSNLELYLNSIRPQ
jgi:hypothetical protein